MAENITRVLSPAILIYYISFIPLTVAKASRYPQVMRVPVPFVVLSLAAMVNFTASGQAPTLLTGKQVNAFRYVLECLDPGLGADDQAAALAAVSFQLRLSRDEGKALQDAATSYHAQKRNLSASGGQYFERVSDIARTVGGKFLAGLPLQKWHFIGTLLENPEQASRMPR